MFPYEIIIQTVVTAIGFLIIFFLIIRASKNNAYKAIKEKFPDISKDKLFIFQEISPKNLPTWRNFLKNKKIKFYYLYLYEDKTLLFNINKEGEINCTEYKRDDSVISIIKNNDLFPGFGPYISFQKKRERIIIGSSTHRKKTIESIIDKLKRILPTELIIFHDDKIEKKSKRIKISLWSLIFIAAGVLVYYVKNSPTDNIPPIYIIIFTLILILVLYCIISLMLLPVERLKYIKD